MDSIPKYFLKRDLTPYDLDLPNGPAISLSEFYDSKVQDHLPQQYRGDHGFKHFFDKVSQPMTPDFQAKGEKYRAMVAGLPHVPEDVKEKAKEISDLQHVKVIFMMHAIIPDLFALLKLPKEVFNCLKNKVFWNVNRTAYKLEKSSIVAVKLVMLLLELIIPEPDVYVAKKQVSVKEQVAENINKNSDWTVIADDFAPTFEVLEDDDSGFVIVNRPVLGQMTDN